MLCGVINIDIVKSRKVEDRAALQKKLNKYIEMLNHKFSGILLAPITITLGDEWQIVISDPWESYNLIQEFQQLFWEDDIKLYAGIGIGTLLTEIDEDVRNMDGPCFILARKAIDIAKKGDIHLKEYIHTKRNRVYFYSMEMSLKDRLDIWDNKSLDEVAATVDQHHSVRDSIANVWNHNLIDPKSSMGQHDYPDLGQLINTLIENNEVLKSKMTNKQKRLFVDYIKYGSYRNIIEAYDDNPYYTSVGNISMMLHKAEYFVIQHNLKVIKDLLGWYCRIWSDAL